MSNHQFLFHGYMCKSCGREYDDPARCIAPDCPANDPDKTPPTYEELVEALDILLNEAIPGANRFLIQMLPEQKRVIYFRIANIAFKAKRS